MGGVAIREGVEGPGRALEVGAGDLHPLRRPPALLRSQNGMDGPVVVEGRCLFVIDIRVVAHDAEVDVVP